MTKLQDDHNYLSLYILQRHECIKMLNDLIELNLSPAFTKIVKRMLRLASDTQNANCKKMSSLHKKLLRNYNNSFSLNKQIVYRCNGASTTEKDNIYLPFADCILDFSKTGQSKPVIPCMLETGSQISVCSYSMFIQLGGDLDSLDKSRSFSISSTTELRDDCILGVVKIDLYIMLKLKQKQPEFGKTFVNMMIGKKQLDIEMATSFSSSVGKRKWTKSKG